MHSKFISQEFSRIRASRTCRGVPGDSGYTQRDSSSTSFLFQRRRSNRNYM